MAKELGYSDRSLVQRCYVAFKIKENTPIQLKVFHYVVCGTCNVDVPLAFNSPSDSSTRNFLCLWGLQQLLETHASTAMMKHGESRRSLFGAIYNWMVF
jgi:hypothetical protein